MGEKMEKTSSIAGVLFVILMSLVQLFQCLSFMKYAPKSENKWHSETTDFFDGCKKVALRFDGDTFIALYSISIGICVSSFVLYIVFGKYIHKVNKHVKPATYILYFIEYVIFGCGFIPMISKFIEVQFCNNDSKIDSYTSAKCFKDEQLGLLLIGYLGVGIAYIMNSVIFPTLKCERNGVEKLWNNEAYMDGIYYLLLIAVVSLFGYLMLPWVGVLLCGAGFLYGLVFKSYERIEVACCKCAVMCSLMWAFACAEILKNNTDAGNDMLYAIPAAFVVGAALRYTRRFLVK
jgi:hypothetical protein